MIFLFSLFFVSFYYFIFILQKFIFEFFVNLKVPKKRTAKDVAKALGKIAMSLTIGSYSTKHFLPLEVENIVGESKTRDDFTKLLDIEIAISVRFTQLPHF